MLADECPNSGEDSEEDVITDYLGPSHSDCDRVLPIINGDLRGLSLHGGIITETGYNTKDNTDKTPITMSEGGDEQHHRQQQQQHPLLALGTNIQAQPNPLVPIISVTPHSPGVAKNYPVLGNNWLSRFTRLNRRHRSVYNSYFIFQMRGGSHNILNFVYKKINLISKHVKLYKKDIKII